MRVRQWAPVTTLILWIIGCAIASGVTGKVPASWPQALAALIGALVIVSVVAQARLRSGKDRSL